MELTLVVLAAGIGRRFGGLKQLEPVGPGGATLMEYTVYDAVRAGFGRVVMVIRPETEAELCGSVGRRIERRLPVACVFQQLTALPALDSPGGSQGPAGCCVPAGRTKPWGTAHAVLMADRLVDEPFAVVNADDFYGASSLAALAQFLQSRQADDLPTYAMVSYTLRHTLAEGGPVSRGVCRANPDGWLESIVEVVGIEKHGADGRYVDARGATQIIPGDTPVSMNLWGFTPRLFDQLRRGLAAFLAEHGSSREAEFYLPAAIQQEIDAGGARVKVLPSKDAWCGVTHPQDKAAVSTMIRRMVAQGAYPGELWD